MTGLIRRAWMCTQRQCVRNDTLWEKFPEVFYNDIHREMASAALVCKGVDALLRNDWTYEGRKSRMNNKFAGALAFAIMLLDDPLTIPDTNTFDMFGGCKRSILRFFSKRTPCNCFDEKYKEVKSQQPKIQDCVIFASRGRIAVP